MLLCYIHRNVLKFYQIWTVETRIKYGILRSCPYYATITSFPSPIPQFLNFNSSATISSSGKQLLMYDNVLLIYILFFCFGPVVIKPEQITSATSTISSSLISGGENGMDLNLFWLSGFWIDMVFSPIFKLYIYCSIHLIYLYIQQQHWHINRKYVITFILYTNKFI